MTREAYSATIVSMLRLEVPRRATVNESPQLARLVAEAEREKGPVEFDCSKTEAWGPLGVALLASCCAVRKRRGYETSIIEPADDDDAKSALDETGLVRLTKGETDCFEEWQVHPISIERGKPVSELSRELLSPLASAAVNAPAVVAPCLNALLDNLYLWSESSVGGFVVVRWQKKHHSAKVALVDRGLGIPAALRRAPGSALHRATDVEVIEAAFSDPNVTSRLEGKMGQGLKTLRETVLSHRGKLTVISLGAKVSWAKDRMIRNASPALHGTAIEMELTA